MIQTPMNADGMEAGEPALPTGGVSEPFVDAEDVVAAGAWHKG